MIHNVRLIKTEYASICGVSGVCVSGCGHGIMSHKGTGLWFFFVLLKKKIPNFFLCYIGFR